MGHDQARSHGAAGGAGRDHPGGRRPVQPPLVPPAAVILPSPSGGGSGTTPSPSGGGQGGGRNTREMPLGRSRVDLPRARDLLLRIEQAFLPLGQPARGSP